MELSIIVIFSVVILGLCFTVAILKVSNDELSSKLKAAQQKLIPTSAIKVKPTISVDQYNDLVRKANDRIRKLREKLQSKNFSSEELKRLKYFIHPDKHNGKSSDLFINISEMSKNDSSK